MKKLEPKLIASMEEPQELLKSQSINRRPDNLVVKERTKMSKSISTLKPNSARSARATPSSSLNIESNLTRTATDSLKAVSMRDAQSLLIANVTNENNMSEFFLLDVVDKSKTVIESNTPRVLSARSEKNTKMSYKCKLSERQLNRLCFFFIFILSIKSTACRQEIGTHWKVCHPRAMWTWFSKSQPNWKKQALIWTNPFKKSNFSKNPTEFRRNFCNWIYLLKKKIECWRSAETRSEKSNSKIDCHTNSHTDCNAYFRNECPNQNGHDNPKSIQAENREKRPENYRKECGISTSQNGRRQEGDQQIVCGHHTNK